MFDAVQEATRIVVGTEPPTLDWRREPASAQEALLRRKYIEHVIRTEGLHLGAAHLLLITLELELTKYPSDLAHALFVLEAASKNLQRQRERETIAQLQREVLFGTAGGRDDRAVTIQDSLGRIEAALNPMDPEILIALIFGGVQEQQSNAA